jgi:rubrerythrin
MGQLLTVSEVVEFAVYIEKNGYKFYVESMKKLKDERLMDLFQYLADEERKHEETFKKLLEKTGAFTPHESYPGEYDAYMRNFLKTHALANDNALKEKLESIKTIDNAVQVALDFEKDSIVLFTMLKKYMNDKNKPLVDSIIQEEVSHILRISQYMQGK